MLETSEVKYIITLKQLWRLKSEDSCLESYSDEAMHLCIIILKKRMEESVNFESWASTSTAKSPLQQNPSKLQPSELHRTCMSLIGTWILSISLKSSRGLTFSSQFSTHYAKRTFCDSRILKLRCWLKYHHRVNCLDKSLIQRFHWWEFEIHVWISTKVSTWISHPLLRFSVSFS
jgi:hypothetical protein